MCYGKLTNVLKTVALDSILVNLIQYFDFLDDVSIFHRKSLR